MKFRTKLILLIVFVALGITANFLMQPIAIQIDFENKYQGPVPLGFDLEHFRETGETIEADNG